MTDQGNLKPTLLAEVGQDKAEDSPGASEPLPNNVFAILVLFIAFFIIFL